MPELHVKMEHTQFPYIGIFFFTQVKIHRANNLRPFGLSTALGLSAFEKISPCMLILVVYKYLSRVLWMQNGIMFLLFPKLPPPLPLVQVSHLRRVT